MGEISNICNEGPVLDNSTPESLARVQEGMEGAEGGGLEIGETSLSDFTLGYKLGKQISLDEIEKVYQLATKGSGIPRYGIIRCDICRKDFEIYKGAPPICEHLLTILSPPETAHPDQSSLSGAVHQNPEE